MEDYNFDGEIHALSNELAYIIKKIDFIRIHEESEMHDIKENMCKKYAEYLYEFGRDEVIKILTNGLMNSFAFGQSTKEDVQFIYRTPAQCSVLNEYATLAIKFKRCKEDKLNECDH